MWLNVTVIILSLGNMDVKGKVSTQGVVRVLPFGSLCVTGTHPCVEQRSPQGTWYCCLPLLREAQHKPSRNPSVMLLLAPGKAGNVAGAGWDGPQSWYCPCSSSAVLAEVLKLLEFQSCPRQKLKNL